MGHHFTIYHINPFYISYIHLNTSKIISKMP